MNRRPLRRITDEEFRALDEDGFVLLKGMFDDEWVTRMQRAMDHVLAHPGPSGVNFSKGAQSGRMAFDKDMWMFNPDFRAFVFDSPAAEIAATALRSPYVNLVVSTLVAKGPHTPIPTTFHQDITGNPVDGAVIGMRVSLDVETPESGAMQWVRGSHKWGRLFIPYEEGADDDVAAKTAYAGYRDNSYNELEMEPIPDIDNHPEDYDIVTTPTEPGDIFLSNLMIIHGAPGNMTDGHRRAFICRFAGQGSTYAVRGNVPFSIGPPFDPGIKHGDPFPDDPHHKVFPRVWSRANLTESAA